MGPHAWVAIGVLVAAMALFITRLVPLAATALAIPVVLAATGTLQDPADALRGFGNHAVIALGAIFVLGAGLKDSGVATLAARGLERLGGRSETRTVIVIMLAAAGLSAFMSNAATVAVLLPAVMVLSRRTHVPPSRLLMPLAFAAIAGGTLTLIGTTPNLIVSSALRTRTGAGFSMFEFAAIGLPVVLLGILYVAFLGRRLLPQTPEQERLREANLPEALAHDYGFRANLYRMRIVPASRVCGKSIRDARIGELYQLDVVLVFRPAGLRGRYLHPRPDLVILPEDQLYMEGEQIDAWRFAEEETVQFGLAGPRSLDRILGRGVALAEVALPPRSGAIGKTITELEFRKRHGLNVISLWRRGQALTSQLADLPLELGDAFLVSGPGARLRELKADPDYIVLGDGGGTEDVSRAPVALALLVVALLPPLLGWLPLALSALASALLMVGTGCTSPANAHRAIDTTILSLLVGTIPLGAALEQQGVASEAARLILHVESLLGPAGLLAALYLGAAIVSTISNNGAAAVILAPVAWQAATLAGVDPRAALLAVAYGASCAFLIPFAHQCNLMVMGAGGYRTRDFLRLGAGMTLVTALATVALLAIR